MYDPYEPTHHWRYRELYHTGYAGSTPERPDCPECNEYPATMGDWDDEPGLCYRCDELDSLDESETER